ncbi:MAG: tRNA (guanosine(46)-N7)-methyltransferase TrmB [Bacteroidia bacterium]|nr:tRNA (guanosine(46)-N7)-methyltransferase TrmB [Bacteroidia bacterium]
MARRKQLKKAEFLIFDNCFGAESQNLKGIWREKHFQNQNPLILELGCGTAALSFGLATLFPDKNYIGIDLKPARLWKPAGKALEDGQKNIAFLGIHLLKIDEYFAEGEADELWITFPDPFPKNKQAKHRMINPPFLKLYRKILKKGGKVHFKTDNPDLFQYALEVFVSEKNIRFHALTFDLHHSPVLNEENRIKTAYEERFLSEGIATKYVCFEFTE